MKIAGSGSSLASKNPEPQSGEEYRFFALLPGHVPKKPILKRWYDIKPSRQYDHFCGGRFRHGTKFLRWRPEKKASSCTFEQLG
jgi:hypothetical protein